MSREIDFDKKLSKDDIAYIERRGNPVEMRRAGLLPSDVSYGLENTPGSLQPHELDGSPEPAFDIDSKVAEESVGEPGAPNVLIPAAEPAKLEQEAFKPEASSKDETAK